MKGASGLVLLLCLPAVSTPDGTIRVEYNAAAQELVVARLHQLSDNVMKRQATLEALFRETGCDGDRLTTQQVPGSKASNVICTLPSDGPGTIVVGAHIDLVDRGSGAVDDWSGAALLPSLYQGLADKPRRHRFIFVGFAAEEVGLHGSKEYVKQLPKTDLAAIRAMVNLECLGLTPPKVWGTRADKQLLHYYIQTATILGQKPAAVNVERVGDDDSHSFLDAKIPVITFHSVTSETWPILHSQRDNLKAIDSGHYYAGYRLAALYLAYLDTVLD